MMKKLLVITSLLVFVLSSCANFVGSYDFHLIKNGEE